MPWKSGLDYKLSALRLRHTNGFISLARDRDTGRVFPDPVSGKPSIDYTISAFDAAHVLEGIVGLAQIAYVTGATEIHAFLPGTEPYVRKQQPKPKPSSSSSSFSSYSTDNETKSSINNETKTKNKTKTQMDLGITDPDFTAWLASVKAAGNKPPYAPFTSAHPMGTCRMSSHVGEGVVDSRGKVWGTDNLFVADASVFPSASGVNPMVTTMAIADWIAQGVSAELGNM
jgi:choline dehydrogenase-like flavoprotein